jgi:hypothetical protein
MWRRAGQMSLNRCKQAPGARHSAEFRTGNPFHGLDQRRQPCRFAGSGAPLMGLLDHRHIRLKTAAGTNPLVKNPFPACRKKPRTNVICFTNDPSDPP